jgi:Flp pilus assembly protein TadG
VTTTESRELGLASTELAVLMPVLIALVLAPIQIGLWWHASQIADAAAREAVDAAQVEGATETDGVAAANRFLDAAGNLTHRNVVVTRTTDTVAVEVTGRAPRLIPGMDWQVTSVAVGAVERYIPPPERTGAP